MCVSPIALIYLAMTRRFMNGEPIVHILLAFEVQQRWACKSFTRSELHRSHNVPINSRSQLFLLKPNHLCPSREVEDLHSLLTLHDLKHSKYDIARFHGVCSMQGDAGCPER